MSSLGVGLPYGLRSALVRLVKERFTILLIEDNENDVLLLRRAMINSGMTHVVRLAQDGMEALNYLRGSGKFADRATYPFPDIILLDLKLPRLSGLELLAWLKDNPEHRVVPTIVLSSSELEDDVRKAYELGANTYLVKPTDFDMLTEMVRKVCDYWEICVKPQKEGEASALDYRGIFRR